MLVSTALRDELTSTDLLLSTSVIQLFSGSMPASGNLPPSGKLLAETDFFTWEQVDGEPLNYRAIVGTTGNIDPETGAFPTELYTKPAVKAGVIGYARFDTSFLVGNGVGQSGAGFLVSYATVGTVVGEADVIINALQVSLGGKIRIIRAKLFGATA